MSVLKKYIPISKAALKYSQGWLTGKRIPLYVGLFITQRCNLKCIYCFPNSPERQKEKEFSKEEIFRIVDEFYNLGTRYITILGGEPLIRRDFGEIVQHMVSKNIIVETGTNGYFTKHKIEDLKKLSLVCHSIDGNEEDMERNRGKGSYQKIIESIELCLANKIPVQLRAVFTKNNVGSLEFLLKLAQKYRTSLGLAEQAVVKYKDNEYTLTQSDLREFWKTVKAYKKKGYPVDKSNLLLDKIIDYPLEFPIDRIFTKEEEVPAGFKYTKCGLSRGYVFLDTNGMLYPCARLFGKFGSSIYENGGIKGAWEALGKNDCLFCRQSIQDLKSYFLSYDFGAIKVAAGNFLRK
ncbi:MAG: radical SAM protein [Deltaproteobacteria bacterium]|nr:radical SAM protein [Deltaproteobacteria bacterium]